jgi:hypothetical protein
LAGGDSHGSFSLNRQLHSPLLRLGWNRQGLFGAYRSSVLLPPDALTAVAAGQPDLRASRLLGELGAGRVLLGNGPLLWFEDAAGRPWLGGRLTESGPLRLCARLPQAGGAQARLRLFAGGDQGEQVWTEHTVEGTDWSRLLPDPWTSRKWLRADLQQADGYAMTNALRPPD